MNNRNILKAYQLLQSMTPDELVMLNLLRGLSESEREQLIEVMGPQTKSPKKSTKKAGKKSQRASSLQQQIQSTSKSKTNGEEKCGQLVAGLPCGAGPSDPIHDETFGYAGYHEFAPGKSIAQSAGD